MRLLHARLALLTALTLSAALPIAGCDSLFFGDSTPASEGSLDAADIAILQDVFGCSPVIGLDLNDSDSGSLSSGDCHVHEGGSLIDYYGFRVGSDGALVTISMSGSFDTYLELYDGDGNLLDSNDDISFPDNLNAQLQRQLGDGLYAIGARAAFPDLTGSYEITISSN